MSGVLPFAQSIDNARAERIAAHLLGVDAFDQPAVEEGQVLAKRYLAENR